MHLLTLASYSAERCRSSLLNRDYTNMLNGGAGILMVYSIICNQVLWCDFGVKKDLVNVIATINSHTHGCAMYHRFYCSGDSNSSKTIVPSAYYHIFG